MSNLSLSDQFLDQSPACHWAVDESGIFRRFWGDPVPILGKTAAELEGRDSSALPGDLATQWKERITRGLAGDILTLRDSP